MYNFIKDLILNSIPAFFCFFHLAKIKHTFFGNLFKVLKKRKSTFKEAIIFHVIFKDLKIVQVTI